MFGSGRSPFRALALVALGFLLATIVAGGGGAVGGLLAALLFIPLLLLKIMFLFFIIGAFFRFAGGGRGPWGGAPWARHRRSGGPWSSDRPHRFDRSGWGGPRDDDGSQWWYQGKPMSPWSQPDDRGRRQQADPEQAEWEAHLREARREVDDIDRPYADDPERDR